MPLHAAGPEMVPLFVVLGAGFTTSSPSTPTIVNVYGRIPQGQNVLLGNYTDTVTATVNF